MNAPAAAVFMTTMEARSMMFTPSPVTFPTHAPKNSKPMGAVGSLIAIVSLAAFMVAATWFAIWICIG